MMNKTLSDIPTWQERLPLCPSEAEMTQAMEEEISELRTILAAHGNHHEGQGGADVGAKIYPDPAAMRQAFEDEYICYEFPSANLRDGALNHFCAGYRAGFKARPTAPSASAPIGDMQAGEREAPSESIVCPEFNNLFAACLRSSGIEGMDAGLAFVAYINEWGDRRAALTPSIQPAAGGEPAPQQGDEKLKKLCEAFGIRVPENLTPMAAVAYRLKDLQDTLSRATNAAAQPATQAPSTRQSARPIDDRTIADTVNTLRDIAVRFHAAGQLRERIADVVVPLLKSARASTHQSAEAILCWSCLQQYTLAERAEADGNCPNCGVEIELDDDARPSLTDEQARDAALAEFLPGTHYTDPPDGGSVTVVEQVRRMALDAARYCWLRDKSQPGICAFYLSVGAAFKNVKFTRETVDEAIDAAIAHSTAAITKEPK